VSEQEMEMEFADLHMDGPEGSYRGYRNPEYQNYAGRTYEREKEPAAMKIDPLAGINPTFMMQMRLGLIIVSLILWVIVFFGSIWAVTRIPGNLSFILYPMIFLGLGIFTVLAVISKPGTPLAFKWYAIRRLEQNAKNSHQRYCHPQESYRRGNLSYQKDAQDYSSRNLLSSNQVDICGMYFTNRGVIESMTEAQRKDT
jgi:hypothetical protein